METHFRETVFVNDIIVDQHIASVKGKGKIHTGANSELNVLDTSTNLYTR